MFGASDPQTPEVPLTRRQLREMREQERLAQLSLQEPDAAWDAAEEPSVASGVAPEPALVAEPASLTTAADVILAAEIAEPTLEPVLLVHADRDIAAAAAADEPVAEDLVTEGLFAENLHTESVRSAEVPLPSRSQLRAEARSAARSRARRVSAAQDRSTLSRPPAPRTTWSPSSPQSASRSSRARSIAAKGVTFAAMAFVALMAVSTSLPAEALLSSADVQAASLLAIQGGDRQEAQEIAVARGTDTITVQRDGYESKSVADIAAASGIRLEATFTNDPNGTIQWPFPVGVHIGDHFGIRHCAGCSVNHGGQDFNPGVGAPIQAIADGVVSVAQDGEGSLGVHMVIDHMINGEKVSSVYAHMIHGSMLFKEGDIVKVGQVIGKTGTTGMSTGPHLHFEIRLGGKDGTKVDPLKWLYANTN